MILVFVLLYHRVCSCHPWAVGNGAIIEFLDDNLK